ncbi:SNARE-binding exocyst subunit S6, variant 2 [Chamberlinius hualienensis]
MDVAKMESEAKARATKQVANMLQRSNQLEKVEHHKRRISRKKATVEAMLKTAMQSQLDGIRSGLGLFQSTLQELQEIKSNTQDIESFLVIVPDLLEKLNEVRSENLKHSQYAAAMENLKHIFTVPESVEETRAWINDGKLLLSHQKLTDLENSRDDLLYELHKLPNNSPSDQNKLKHYFSEVDKLSEELGKQVSLVLKRTLNIVCKEPTVIVTALRIIEREEAADQFHIQRYKQTGFMPPGRPKSWRAKAFGILENAVQERIEGNQFEERKDNKMWLVRHLEVTRQIVLQDLKIVKSLCIPCFPPSYDIFNKYVMMYHDCLSRHFQEVIENGLEGNEIITVLAWINTYSGPEMLAHPDLGMDPKKIAPVLDNAVIEDLVQKYLSLMEQNYQDWMRKTMDTDVQDWYRETQPETDNEGYYHTVMPVIIFQIIDQHIQVANTVSEELVHRILMLGMKQILQFAEMYRDAIVDFKTRYFEDRNKVKYFTHYMIAVVNNCLHLSELSQTLKTRYWKPGTQDNDMTKQLEAMINTFETLRIETSRYLLEEVFLDLETHFQDLMTKKWMTSSTPIDTICCTIEDYCSDYRHLRLKNFDQVIIEALNKICKSYIAAILQKRNTFKNYEERRFAAEKIFTESDQIKSIFKRINPPTDRVNLRHSIFTNIVKINLELRTRLHWTFYGRSLKFLK